MAVDRTSMASRWHGFVPWAACVLLAFIAGCPQPQDAQLPDELDVEMPGGTVVAASIDSGPPLLANTVWACYRQDNDDFLVRIEFGDDGRILRFFDNTAYNPSHLGKEVFPDRQFHPFVLPSNATYLAAAYGTSVGAQFGVAMNMQAWWLGQWVGYGRAYVFGTRSEDRFEGTFGYYGALDLPTWNGTRRDRYAIYALLEE